MDIQGLLNVAQQFVPANVWQKGLAVVGVVSLCKEAIPKLLTKGTPAMTKAADWTAKTLLNSPARPLVLWLSPNIVVFLDALVDAITQLLDTFKNELEADLKAAQNVAPAVVVASVAPDTKPS